jgi:3,4-dihydroxy 2-butanone 4-phosphate synthase/GTP cyclohydrolase II
MIEEEGRGVVVYLRLRDQEELLLHEIQEHKGVRLRVPEQATLKEYGIGAQMIVDLGLHNVRLLTNHPKKLVGLEGFDINIVEQIPIASTSSEPRSPHIPSSVLHS